MCYLSTGRRFSSRRQGAGTGGRTQEQGAAREKESGAGNGEREGGGTGKTAQRGSRRLCGESAEGGMAPGNGQWGQDSEEPGRLGDRAGRRPEIFGAEAGGKPDQGRVSRERSRIGRGGGAAGARETSGIALPGAGTGGIRGRGRARGQSSAGGRGNWSRDRGRGQAADGGRSGRFRSDAGRKPERLCPVTEKMGEFAKKCLPRQAVFYTRTAVPRWWNW